MSAVSRVVNFRYPLALTAVLILMVVTPIAFILQKPRFNREDIPLKNLKSLLNNSTNVYFLHVQFGSVDYESAQELANALANYSLIEHEYQLGDSFVDSNGYPRPEAISKGDFIVLVGGPCAHACVKFYEDTKQAPLIQKWTDAYIWFETRDGKIANETFVARSDLNEHYDMFVIEFFRDNDGRNVLIYYGNNWQGTLAAGRYFSQMIYPRISDYNRAYYIFDWVDSNNDTLPDVGEVIERA
jgi:hypothetical protein